MRRHFISLVLFGLMSSPALADHAIRLGGETLPAGHRILQMSNLLDGRGTLVVHGNNQETDVWVAWRDGPEDTADYHIAGRLHLNPAMGHLRLGDECTYNRVNNPNIVVWQPNNKRMAPTVWMTSLADGQFVEVPQGDLTCSAS